MADCPELPAYVDVGPQSGQVLLFLHGFPDDATVWSNQVAHFSALGYRCVTCTLPHYNDAHHSGIQWRALGYSNDEICDMICGLVKRIDPSGRGVVLVGHDFGSVYSFFSLMKYPELFKAFVTFDVGYIRGLLSREVSAGAAWTAFRYFLIYQGLLIFIWLCSLIPMFGKVITCPCRLVLKPASIYSYWHLQMDYWARCFAHLSGISSVPDKFACRHEGSFTDFPGCPTLFIWGTKKPMMLHDKEWEHAMQKRAREDDGSRAHGLPCFHYPMKEQPAESNKLMQEFLLDVSSLQVGSPKSKRG
eukprot:CAMPEP_0203882282 /NCGR_PEP_ID=MMETSP0359-20131031/26517_1 /ASSEMBLY_ACC=CAM_ASM_000338 /TAXON_ID=268821 /ORGANISM="Scrippsiella Hangoei, Strain SHTV-5" /LENGTH=302 /DNA_ID=CAMNT_0050802305 /DNA_START=41 /DNA_END=949 /DNA_ORIENTATION=+